MSAVFGIERQLTIPTADSRWSLAVAPGFDRWRLFHSTREPNTKAQAMLRVPAFDAACRGRSLSRCSI